MVKNESANSTVNPLVLRGMGRMDCINRKNIIRAVDEQDEAIAVTFSAMADCFGELGIWDSDFSFGRMAESPIHC